jgi:hypothetical protein
MQGRYTTFLARQPGQLAPGAAIKAAMLCALERAWRNPRHTHERFRAAPSPGAARVSSIRPQQKD